MSADAARSGANTRATIRAAADQLSSVSDTPRLDAELLLAHALGIERSALLLDPERYVVPEGFGPLIMRRLNHEPVAYIQGYRDFWTIRLAVGPGVLIPRPDSEVLIEAAVDHFGDAGPATILDLGTGPGTLLLATLDQWPAARGVGIDASAVALDYARRNAAQLNMADRVQFSKGGWVNGGSADLILCNPPYIGVDETLDTQVCDFEPAEALFAGPDGLDDYRQLLPALRGRLHDGGLAVIEIGATQRVAVSDLAQQAGFTVSCRADLGGRDRAILCSAA